LVSGSEQVVGILSSLNSFTASNSTTNIFTSSATARLNSIEVVSASNLNRLYELENKTGSLASTGSNTFYGNQIISGTTWIAGDFIVQGSSSIQYISASSVSIGTNIVNLNTANPAVRYGGISVQDSGSANGVTGSMLWDSTCNRWIYSNPSGVGYSGGVLMSGPRAQTLGQEVTLTCNYVAKSGGGDHLYDSCIYESSGSVGINTNNPGEALHVLGNIQIPGTNCLLITSGNSLNIGSKANEIFVLNVKSATSSASRVDMWNANNSTKSLVLDSNGATPNLYLNSGNGGTAVKFRLTANETSQQVNFAGESNHSLAFWTDSSEKLKINNCGVVTFTPSLPASSCSAVVIKTGSQSDLVVQSCTNGTVLSLRSWYPTLYFNVCEEKVPTTNSAWEIGHRLNTNNLQISYMASGTANRSYSSSHLVNFTTDGYVGINCTTPSYTLDVNGNVRLGSNIYTPTDALNLYSGTGYLVLTAGGGSSTFGTPTGWGGNANIRTGGTNRISIDSNGIACFQNNIRACQGITATYLEATSGYHYAQGSVFLKKLVNVNDNTTTTLLTFNQNGSYSYIGGGEILIVFVDPGSPWGVYVWKGLISIRTVQFGSLYSTGIQEISSRNNLDGTFTVSLETSKDGGVANAIIRVVATTGSGMSGTAHVSFNGWVSGGSQPV
jgi:hypothetical protein